MTEEYGHISDGFFMENTEKPFYRFFAVEYFATGEGMSFWLKVCRNDLPIDDRDHEMEDFKEFLGHSHYYPGIEELTEEQFLERYAKLIPEHTKAMISRRDQPAYTWETHIHFNYS